jgi:hypothetical protein
LLQFDKIWKGNKIPAKLLKENKIPKEREKENAAKAFCFKLKP